MFWNVAGLYNKDKDFWRFLNRYDMVSLSETWVDEKSKDKLLEALPGEFKWEIIPAKKIHKKGRAKGGMVLGIKGEWA